MSKKRPELRIRFVATLMSIVALNSTSASIASTTEAHDAGYINSVQNAVGEVQPGLDEQSGWNADATAPATEAPSPGLPQTSSSVNSVPSQPLELTPTSAEIEATLASPDLATSAPEGDIVPSPGPVPDIDGQPIAALPPPPAPDLVNGDVLTIDSDSFKTEEENSTHTWADVKSEDGKSFIHAGARFPVVLLTSHNSKTCHVGDRVEARLKADIVIGERLIACKNAHVIGHVSSAHKARRVLFAQMSPKRWLRANGAIGIKFDEIITHGGDHIPLAAAPARMPRIIENKAEGRVLGINHKGEIASPLSIQLKHQAVQFAIRGAAGAGGVFSMGAVPVLFGIIGAINPTFAFLHPVGKNVPHRRLKGFGMGFLNGLPGGFLIADFCLRGAEAKLKPGDEFLAEFQQDFTGEAATVAELLPSETTKVKGEVMGKPKKTKKSKKSSAKTPASVSSSETTPAMVSN